MRNPSDDYATGDERYSTEEAEAACERFSERTELGASWGRNKWGTYEFSTEDGQFFEFPWQLDAYTPASVAELQWKVAA